MSPILVTGGSGFIGAAAVEALAKRGDKVVVLDRSESSRLREIRQAYPSVVFAPADLTEWSQIADVFQRHKPSAVIHSAAIVGIVNSLASPNATMRVNVEGSLNVLGCMRLFDTPRMINLSTEEIYGQITADIIDETHPCLPEMPYAISKFAVEQLARDYAKEHDLSVINLRTCWVYGPRMPRPRVPKTLVDAAIEGRPLHLPDGGDFRVDQVYIDDLTDGILQALDHPHHHFDAYHITTGTAPSVGEIVAIIRELVPGVDISVGPGHYTFDGKVAPVRKGALDCSRARKEFGYSPRFDIRAGIAAYLEARRNGVG